MLPATQGLSRALNNLGSLLADDPGRDQLGEAGSLHEQAVRIHSDLVARAPANREYKLELAKFYNNLSYNQSRRGLPGPARQSNERARALLEDLARPAPSLDVDLADVHTLRGQLLEQESVEAALEEYEEALRIFERLDNERSVRRPAEYHQRFGELLSRLAVLVADHGRIARARTVLARALAHYLSIGERIADSGAPSEARALLDNMSRVMPELQDRDRPAVDKRYQELEPRLRARATSKVEG
jgi:tetratricopeptide (TPR) repeat protein